MDSTRTSTVKLVTSVSVGMPLNVFVGVNIVGVKVQFS